MAGTRRPAPAPISIGNCTVEMNGDGLVCQSSAKGLHISSPSGTRIKISVDDSSRKYMTRGSYKTLMSSLKSEGGGCFPFEDHEFVLLNPKDVDSCSKSLLQKVLKIYSDELPTMNYAANTGKESLFLERCISSGKYRTLILRSCSIKGLEEVIAAVSYQIIPTDTHFAEIPLAAVTSKYQSKGIGCLLYKELRERLQNVGVLTIFCWGDKESAGFWLKQGFISIGEVDSKGKAHRLPIKADIRRALCFPGDSTLMVAHLQKDVVASVNSSKQVSLCSSKFKADNKLENRNDNNPEINFPCESLSHPGSKQIGNPKTQQTMSKGYDSDLKHCSSSGQNVKRQVCEASSTSLKSKRVRGGYDHVATNDSTFIDYSLNAYRCNLSDDAVSDDPKGLSSLGTNSKEKGPDQIRDDVVLKGCSPRIMLMNIADDTKRTGLTKIVEKLGGSVTCEGSACTHVITGKARRTLNFCVALCSGAWIVSPHWLKASFREGKFLGESKFLLEDDEYRLKYKSELRDAVKRARENPHALLRRFDFCLAKHVQPSVHALSAIIKSAGGNVIGELGCVEDPSRVIFVACEVDMEEALGAAKKGVWSFSSDWLMSCVMKQELDLEAPQFAESL